MRTPIVGDFNIPLTSMDRSSRWKVNKAMEKLGLLHYFQDITSKKKTKQNRIYILFKYTLNILND